MARLSLIFAAQQLAVRQELAARQLAARIATYLCRQVDSSNGSLERSLDCWYLGKRRLAYGLDNPDNIAALHFAVQTKIHVGQGAAPHCFGLAKHIGREAELALDIKGRSA